MSKLYFRYGVMGSGKTTALLQVVDNYKRCGMNIVLLKPSIDTKADNKVSSRIGIEREVDYLVSKEELPSNLINFDNLSAVLVDEAQFLSRKQVDDLYKITKERDIPVICYGLRTDFKTNGFEGSIRLLEVADSIEELKNVCSCGKKATINIRYINEKVVFDGESILIDGSKNHVRYSSSCGKCYLKLRKENKNE